MNDKTYQPKAKDINRTWHLIDADGQVLGRLSTRIAILLMGKHKTNFTAHLDMGDHVVVTNAEKVILTGGKETKKLYWRHSGYPGGMKTTSAAKVRAEHPERLIIHSVSGMLPKNKHRDPRLTRLHVYVGPNHPYTKQVNHG
jgi:large subunit ribosomal protein L13